MFVKKLKAWMTAGAMALALVSCSSESEFSNGGERTAISFLSTASTRASVLVADDLNAFNVWGFRHSAADGETWSDVFRESPISVEENGGTWSYGYEEYWTKGNNYVFYAFYPTEVKEDVSANEAGATVTNFDSTKHIDLLYATNSRDYDTQGGSAIVLNFQHLLSNVTFAGRIDPTLSSEGIEVTLTSVKLYGGSLSKTGSWTSVSDRWTHGEATTGSAPFVELSERIPLSSDNEIDLFENKAENDNELLLIPQTELRNVYFRIEYEYSGSISTSTRTGLINLGTIPNAVTSWEAGKRYKYSFTIGKADYILFKAPTVEAWKDNEIGGDSAIDKP